jgi:hypothetical protein
MITPNLANCLTYSDVANWALLVEAIVIAIYSFDLNSSSDFSQAFSRSLYASENPFFM